MRDVVRILIGLSPTAKINGSKTVTSRDFTRDKKVILANFSSTFSVGVGHVSQGINCRLGGLVITEPINIKGLDEKT